MIGITIFILAVSILFNLVSFNTILNNQKYIIDELERLERLNRNY